MREVLAARSDALGAVLLVDAAGLSPAGHLEAARELQAMGFDMAVLLVGEFDDADVVAWMQAGRPLVEHPCVRGVFTLSASAHDALCAALARRAAAVH